MIVIGTDVIENYLADRAGHKGIKAAVTISSLAQHCDPRQLAQSGGGESIIPESEHSQGRPRGLQHQKATITDW